MLSVATKVPELEIFPENPVEIGLDHDLDVDKVDEVIIVDSTSSVKATPVEKLEATIDELSVEERDEGSADSWLRDVEIDDEANDDIEEESVKRVDRVEVESELEVCG